MLSRAKPAVAAPTGDDLQQAHHNSKKMPQLETFLANRDYSGAITFLEVIQTAGHGMQFECARGNNELENAMWIGYCAFHAGEYKKAMEVLKS